MLAIFLFEAQEGESAAIRLGLRGATLSVVILSLQFHATFCIRYGSGHSECLLCIAFERSFRHLYESILYACALDRTRLKEQHVVVFACPLLASCTGNLTFRLLVELVADADEWERLWIGRSSVLMEAVAPARK